MGTDICRNIYYFLKTGSHYVALVDLELTMEITLDLNSQRSNCFSLQSARVKGASP